jgi:hypothetical protein
MSVPRVSTSLVHFTHVGPTCLTSGSHLCHVSIFHWSISPALATWQNTLRFLKNTWQSLIGPHHKPLPFGSLWMVHSNKEKCQMAASEWATSTAECHMALPYWSTSAMWAPPYHKMTDKWAPLSATWQAQIGAMSLHRSYMWLLLVGTSQHEVAHMTLLGRATSLITNRSLVLRVCLLSNQPIRPCHLSTLTMLWFVSIADK